MVSNTIELNFADGEYTFALPLAQMNELQHKTGVGIGGLFTRVLKGCSINADNDIVQSPSGAEFYAADIIETLRQGLIGGGKGVVNAAEIAVTPQVANRLIDNYVLTRPLMESWGVVAAVLGAVIIGYSPPKKDEPAKARAPRKTAKTKDGSTTA